RGETLLAHTQSASARPSRRPGSLPVLLRTLRAKMSDRTPPSIRLNSGCIKGAPYYRYTWKFRLVRIFILNMPLTELHRQGREQTPRALPCRRTEQNNSTNKRKKKSER